MKQNLENKSKKENKLNYNRSSQSVITLKTKIVLGVLCIIILAITVLFIVETLVLGETSYFSKHFATAIVLVCIGFIIMILVSSNKSKVTGESKGDGLMEKIAIAAFILGILSIAFSYIGF